MIFSFQDTGLQDTPLIRAAYTSLAGNHNPPGGMDIKLSTIVVGSKYLLEECLRDTYLTQACGAVDKVELAALYLLSNVRGVTDLTSFAENLPLPLSDKFMPFMAEREAAQIAIAHAALDATYPLPALSPAMAVCLMIDTIARTREFLIYATAAVSPLDAETKEKGKKWFTEKMPFTRSACEKQVEAALLDAHQAYYLKACAHYGVVPPEEKQASVRNPKFTK